MAKLITIRGPTRGREFKLAEQCVLGRSPSCEVYIGDLAVSREHARLTSGQEGWVLEDLGSGNGTFVNDQRVTRTVLRTGDEIRVSNCLLRFMTEEAEQRPRWVNMVTVLAGNEPGLVHTATEVQLRVPQLMVDKTQTTMRDDLARSQRMLEALYAVSNAVASTLEPKPLFEHILDYLFQTFPDADRGFVMVLDDSGQLVPAAIRLRGGQVQAGGLVVSQTVVGDVLQQGRAVLSTGNTSGPWAGAKMCAPLAAQGRTHGILLLETRDKGRPFTAEDLDLLTGVAAQAGVAFLSARMHQRLLSQQRLEQDMHFARQIQQSFLPAEPPDAPGFHFDRRYDPVYEVGGDFYDFIPLPDRQLGVLIGDVSGKGVSAALLMARLTSDMRYFALAERTPSRVLQRANLALCSSSRDNMFATVLYLVLDLDRGVLTFCNAGHLPPLLRQAATGEVTAIDDATNLALGVLPEAVFDEASLELRAGDSLVLCTDGVVEAKSPTQEEYGLVRLQQAMAGAPSQVLLDLVLRDLDRHTAGSPQYDDITLVSVSRLG